ncbi:MAG TPA: hypothetical protein VJ992_09950 [Gemmatimonadales bacterium]|jgi:hypothetical protein|nr:hypothetical protein [Gemmatimonadales bacterium]
MLVSALWWLAQAEPFPTAVTGRHHEGPRNVFDYVLVVLAIAIVIVVTVLCVKYFARPGEKNADHIKRRILGDDL